MIKILQPYIKLMRLNSPIGIYLLLWPTLMALWLASDGMPDLKIFGIFTAGVVIMRSCGCVINDFADRDFDQHVERTKNRPLAAKQIHPQAALLLFGGLLFLAFLLASKLNFKTMMLASVAAALAIIYPFSKRFTKYPQVILGLAFAWSIPMAYMQIQQHIPVEAWVLLASIMCWVVAYDTLYAMADKADDLKIGIQSTAITFGAYDKQIIFLLHSLALHGFVFIGVRLNFIAQYFVGLLIALCIAMYQQFLIKDRDPKLCLEAFLNNYWFGAAIFWGIVSHYIAVADLAVPWSTFVLMKHF